MENFDVNNIINNDNEYKRIVDTAIEYFKCNWDDNIHDSYQRYLKQIQEHSQNVHNIRCRTEEIKLEIEELKIDDIINEAENLCREADSI